MSHHKTDLSNSTLTSSQINQSQSLNISGNQNSRDKSDTNDISVPVSFFTNICGKDDNYCNHSHTPLNTEKLEIDIEHANDVMTNNSDGVDLNSLYKSGDITDRNDDTAKKKKNPGSNCPQDVIKINNLNDHSFWDDVTSTTYTNKESMTNIYHNDIGQTSCDFTKSIRLKNKSKTMILMKETGKNGVVPHTANVLENQSSVCLTIGLHQKSEIDNDKLMFDRESINSLSEFGEKGNGQKEVNGDQDENVSTGEYKKSGEKSFIDRRICRKSNLKRTIEETESSNGCEKRTKRSISFDKVSVFYFQRTQGFICVPSKGGSTLGMTHNHSYTRNFSLNEYAEEQKRIHREQMLWNNSNQSSHSQFPLNNADDSEDSEEVDDVEYDNNPNYIQPIPTRERRAILRSAGVDKIESSEKEDCKAIRISREYCGCQCQTYCNPDTCICSQSGIKCQMDRLNFPCSCTRDGCANVNGRIEFNALRVRTHYIRTLMRMQSNDKAQQPPRNHIDFPLDYYTSSPMQNINFNYGQYVQQGASCVDSMQHTYQSCYNSVSHSSNSSFNVSSYGSTYINPNSSLMNWSSNGLIMDNHSAIMRQCVMDKARSDMLYRYVEGHTNSNDRTTEVPTRLISHSLIQTYETESGEILEENYE